MKFARKQLVGLIFTSIIAGCTAGIAHADDGWENPYYADYDQTNSLAQVEMGTDYALGIGRFDLDSHTEILGWQISNSWYFGRQDGLDSGLTLVWQRSANQVSLSKDGLRLTRRF